MEELSVYITEQGDMWDLIAKKVYGHEKYEVDLMRSNPDYLETVVFGAGVLLFCPVISKPYSYSLPPWKRRG